MKLTLNRNGMAALAKSTEVQEACVRAGRVVEAAARAMPMVSVGSAEDRRGYEAAFRTEPAMVTMDKARDTKVRAGALVINDHEMEHIFGGRNRTLYRALEALNGVKIR